MKANKLYIITCLMLMCLWACKKEPQFDGEHNMEVIKNYHNNTTSVSKMDSLTSINFITKQKLLEVYELSLLYHTNKKDSILSDLFSSQLSSYFLENDTINVPKITQEMDSLRVKFVEIAHLTDIKMDTLSEKNTQKVNYWVKYYASDKKLIDSLEKSAEFLLQKQPKKFKHEFTFYFLNINHSVSEKDSIR